MIGDFNLKVTSAAIKPEITEKHILREKNERGERLIDFGQEE